MPRSAVILLAVWAAVAAAFGMCSVPSAPVQGSTALCETADRFHPDEQEAWDFWMGPYGHVPCKWLNEPQDV